MVALPHQAYAFKKSDQIGTVLETFHSVLTSEFLPVIMLSGVLGSLVFAFIQQSLKAPLITITACLIFGGAKGWISTAYTLIR